MKNIFSIYANQNSGGKTGESQDYIGLLGMQAAQLRYNEKQEERS